jgi:hypothetical protein
MARNPIITPPAPGGYSPSGVPVSGGPSNLSGTPGDPFGISPTSGPHAVERQTLNISYVRVPVGKLQSHTLGLSSATATYTHKSTYLHCRLTATYSMKKSYAFYNSSSYQQPQKFDVVGTSSDAEGNLYGDLDASSLGPQGDVVTLQPWLKRVPWNSAIHEEYVSSVDAYTCRIYSSSGAATTGNGFGYLIEDSFGDFEKAFINTQEPGAFQGNTWNWPADASIQGQIYALPGTYGTSQETIQKMIQMIDGIGTKVRGQTVYDNSGSQTGLWKYDEDRHDYS